MDHSLPLTPEMINSLFQEACENHQNGNLSAAKSAYLTVLQHVDAPMLQYNLGLVHHELQEMEEALACFAKAHEGNPEDRDTLFNLALCQKICGQFDNAGHSYLKLLALEPDHVDGIYNLAGCYRAQERDEEAIALYLQVLEKHPAHQGATSNVAYLYQRIGDTARAIQYYQILLQLDPDRHSARHMLAALLGETSETPPESYVRGLFDSYSDHYEESLVQNLEYDVPVKLRKMLLDLADTNHRFREGIDLGCGTGLSGVAFSDLVENLDGVDLSPKMIDIARKKAIYRNLLVDNISSFFSSVSAQYDLVLAADVFGYLGNLTPTMQMISRCTVPGAVICFSTETASGQTYRLQRSGRFAHSQEYILGLAREQGWTVVQHQPVDLRRERDGWVSGTLWIMRK